MKLFAGPTGNVLAKGLPEGVVLAAQSMTLGTIRRCGGLLTAVGDFFVAKTGKSVPTGVAFGFTLPVGLKCEAVRP